jgi:hypothetical protein
MSGKRKFPAFFLPVPNILLIFANAYKMIVVYPAGRPFRLWLPAAGFFYASGIHFPNWRKIFSQLGKKENSIWRLHEP